MRTSSFSEVKKTIQEYMQLRPMFRAQKTDQFNVFRILGIASDEMRHSRILAWLLEAESEHGQSSEFLKAFAALCGIALNSHDLLDYTVVTELAVLESIIDIAVYKPGSFLIYIENKVFAVEGNQQLLREFSDLRRLGAAMRVPETRQYAIFLTPTGREPVSAGPSQWISISYGQISAVFRSVVSKIEGAKTRWLIQDWLAIIESWGVTID